MKNEELILLAQQGNSEAMAQLYENNAGIIHFVCRPLVNTAHALDDLKQEAYFGLLQAVRGFDPSRGILFVSYLKTAVKRHLWRYMRYSSMNAVLCLDMPVYADNDTTLLEQLQDDIDVEDEALTAIEAAEINKAAQYALNLLSEREQHIIECHYLKGQTLTAIAERLNISIERVRQLKSNALRVLHKPHHQRAIMTLYDDIEAAGLRGTSLTSFKYNGSATERAAIKLYEGRL